MEDKKKARERKRGESMANKYAFSVAGSPSLVSCLIHQSLITRLHSPSGGSHLTRELGDIVPQTWKAEQKPESPN